MSKSFLIFKKYVRSFVVAVFSLVLVFSAVNFASANEWTFTDSFESRNLGDLNGQDGWAVTNRYGNSNNAVNISTTNPGEGTKSVEITNNDSLTITRDITPINAGIFQFRMRHNKSGLFYFNALTSDMGGQLLFSIQFTQSNGILLEEATKQITLLPDYNANQWYLFTIDFNNRGEKRTFKIKIDDGSYSEYKYVNSESAIFDFAQIVFGSESGTAISAFGDIKSAPSSSITITKETSATSTNATGIIPLIINSVLDFFGINTETTSTTAPVTDTVSSTTDTIVITSVSSAATTTEEAAITTPQAEEIILPPQDEATSSPIETALQAAVGTLRLGRGNIFVAIIIAIGILLLLAFTLSRKNKKKKTKR